MRGKRGLIMGVANNRSIAWGIAKACRAPRRRARLHLPGRRVEEARRAAGRGGRRHLVGHCDVTDPATIDAVFAAVRRALGPLDFVVHAIAFSDKDELDGRYVETTQDNFTKTMLISCYSFTAVAQRAEKLMTERRLAC